MLQLASRVRRHELLCMEHEALAVAQNIIEWAPIEASITVKVVKVSPAEIGVHDLTEFRDGLGGYLIEWTERPNPTIKIYATGNIEEDRRRQSNPINFSINAAIMYRDWLQKPAVPWTKVLTAGGETGDVIRGQVS